MQALSNLASALQASGPKIPNPNQQAPMGGQPQPRPMFPPQGQPGMMPPQPQPGMGQMQPPQMQPQVMPQQQHAPQMPPGGGIVPPNFGQAPGMGMPGGQLPRFQPGFEPRGQGPMGGGYGGGQFGGGQWAQRFQQRQQGQDGAQRLGGLMGLRG